MSGVREDPPAKRRSLNPHKNSLLTIRVNKTFNMSAVITNSRQNHPRHVRQRQFPHELQTDVPKPNSPLMTIFQNRKSRSQATGGSSSVDQSDSGYIGCLSMPSATDNQDATSPINLTLEDSLDIRKESRKQWGVHVREGQKFHHLMGSAGLGFLLLLTSSVSSPQAVSDHWKVATATLFS